jgi:thioredoxin-related protein
MSQNEKVAIRIRTLDSPQIPACNLRQIRYCPLVLGLLLALFLCHPAAAVPTRETTVLPPKIQDLPREAPGEPLHWLTDLQEALSLASRSNRPVIVYFYSPECSWCRRLDQDTLQMPETRKALAGFVLARVNVLEDEKTPARYRVRGTPVLVFLSPEGRESFRLEGFVDSLTLKDAVDEILGPKGRTPGQSISEKLELLKANKLPESDWPDLLLALGEQNQREPILQALARMNPPPRAKLVELLEHRLLAVRLGALEILEGWTGDDFNFDPWKEKAQANSDAIQKWKAWLTNADNTNAAPAVYQTLSPEETEAYLRDYLSEDRDRAERAKRMLQRGGASSLQGLQSYLTNNAD